MKSIISIASVLLILPFFCQAQKGKGRERTLEKQRYETNVKYFNDIFGEQDPDFEINQSPEKWKDEPVVMLCQKTHIGFLRNPDAERSMTKGAIRQRILIQDKSALENFSEFYYQESLAVGLRHIKADGSQKDIGLENAVKVETDIPGFYTDSYQSTDYYKIAIPDLEVGDIIDFFKVFTQNYGTNIELISTISSSVPIVRQEYIFDIDKFWNFFYGTFNGAPEFIQEEEGGIDSKGRQRKIVKRFVLKDSDRAPQKKERWDYLYLTEPILKVMAMPPNAKLGNKPIKDIVKNKLSAKACFKPMILQGRALSKNSTLASTVSKRLNTLGIKKMPVEKKINTIYNVIRFEFLRQSIAYQALRPNNTATLTHSDHYYSMASHVFAALFADILADYNIDSKFILAVPRYYGDTESVVVENEMEFGVFVPSSKQYYWTVDNYRSLSDFYSDLSGATGYQINYGELRKKDPAFKSITIPVSKALDHVSRTDLNILVNEDYSFAIKSKFQFTGVYKERYSPLFLYQSDYLEEDSAIFLTAKEKSRSTRISNRKIVKKQLEKVEKQRAELSEDKREAIHDWLKTDFELKTLEGFEVTSFGRFEENNTLEVEIDFSTENYLQKAGPNLIMNIGKMISGQIELDNKEIEKRNKPVELGYARMIENNIEILLPEGYSAQGLDPLNIKLDNKNAAFISEVSQEGNTLRIKTSKIYKSERIPESEWKTLVDMLEAAYEFSQKKIILKK